MVLYNSKTHTIVWKSKTTCTAHEVVCSTTCSRDWTYVGKFSLCKWPPPEFIHIYVTKALILWASLPFELLNSTFQGNGCFFNKASCFLPSIQVSLILCCGEQEPRSSLEITTKSHHPLALPSWREHQSTYTSLCIHWQRIEKFNPENLVLVSSLLSLYTS